MSGGELTSARRERTSGVAGRLEGVRRQVAYGWAVRAGEPASRLTIEILDRGAVVAAGEARPEHSRLRGRAPGNGRPVFAVRLPASIFDGEPRVLRAREAASGVLLAGEQVIGGSAPTHGEIEGVSAHVLFGWVAAGPGEVQPQIEVRVDGEVVGVVPAGLRRDDIVANGLANRAAGFRFDLSAFLRPGANQRVAVADAATGREIPGSPFSLAERPASGVLDTVAGIELAGWAVLAQPGAGPAVMEVLIDGEPVGEAPCTLERADVASIGAQDSRCGFSFVVPARFFDGAARRLAARVKGTGVVLRGGRRKLRIALRYGIEALTEHAVSGWITNVVAPQRPLPMHAWVDGRPGRIVLADRPHELVGRSGRMTIPAGFAVEMPAAAPGWIERRIRLCAPGSEDSLTGTELVVSREPGRSAVAWREARVPAPADATVPVDVIVVACEAGEKVLACAQSVLNRRDPTACQLIVVDDAALEPRVHAALRLLAEHAGFTLLRNPRPCGFARSVRAASLLHRGRDVVLLDPRGLATSEGWISRLRDAAYAAADIGAVAGGEALYLRRAALDDTDLGEPGEFLRRSAELGWRQVRVESA